MQPNYKYMTKENLTKKELKYLAKKLGRPDKGSEFEQKLGNKKYLFRIPIARINLTKQALKGLEKQGYDVLFLKQNKKIRGHTATQYHPDNTLHIFSVYVEPKLRGKGLAYDMLENILIDSFDKYPGVERIRLGKGGHDSMQAIQKKLCDNYPSITEYQKGNWIKLKKIKFPYFKQSKQKLLGQQNT